MIPLLKSQIVVGFSFSNRSHLMGKALRCCQLTAGLYFGRALWPPAPSFCSQVTRKSYFHTNHNDYNDGHPRFYSFRALGSFQFSLEHGIRQSHCKSIFYFSLNLSSSDVLIIDYDRPLIKKPQVMQLCKLLNRLLGENKNYWQQIKVIRACVVFAIDSYCSNNPSITLFWYTSCFPLVLHQGAAAMLDSLYWLERVLFHPQNDCQKKSSPR